MGCAGSKEEPPPQASPAALRQKSPPNVPTESLGKQAPPASQNGSWKPLLRTAGSKGSGSIRVYLAKDIVWKKGFSALYSVPDVKPLGKGAFGVVRLAKHRASGQEYAVKFVAKKSLNEQSKEFLDLEVKCMWSMRGTLNSVHLEDTFEEEHHYLMVMELCRGGELYGRLKQGDYTEDYAANIAENVSQFIAQCRAKHLVYRDVKPANFIFLDSQPDSPLKATDFGLAVYLENGARANDITGTPYYMAPEVIREDYGFEADMWSVGVMTYQLLCGRLPFPGAPKSAGLVGMAATREIFKQIVLGAHVDFAAEPWPMISEDGKDFVKRCMERDPSKRMSPLEALNHPWIKTSKMEKELSDKPLLGTVVQRLQRFSSYSTLKQLLLTKVVLKASSLDDDEVTNIRALYEQIDTDGSGALSVDETIAGLHQIGYNISEGEVRHICSSVDADGSGEIDYEEFLVALADWKVMSLQQTGRWRQVVEDLFTDVDNDHSGFIDTREIASLVGGAVTDRLVVEGIIEADADGDGKISKEEFMQACDPPQGEGSGAITKSIPWCLRVITATT